jgi:general secretion pathway protein E
MNAHDLPLANLPQIDPAIIARARKQAAEEGIHIIHAIDREIGIGEAAVVTALAARLRMSYFDTGVLEQATADFSLWTFSEATRSRCAVVKLDDMLLVVLTDPFDDKCCTQVESRYQHPLERALAHPADLEAWLSRREESMRAMSAIDSVAAGDPNGFSANTEELSLAQISEDESPVVRIVNSTLYDGLKAEASDIHLETRPDGLHVLYRIDGVLNRIAHVADRALAQRAISRVKVLAELDISETRVPQDGRFKASIKGRGVDFRVSVMPSMHGEDIVLRILDKQNLTTASEGLSLTRLGFDEHSVEQIRRHITEAYGMVLVTGPTGSGKTTTLYAALSEINNGRDKIVTIEDPIEYQLPGVLQIPVNEKKGLGFARGLRSILRHDPDKILVGEIRDPETAQIAVQSALTGHLVFTSVHANNTFDVFGRFAHMGVDSYSFVSALNVVIAQRLIRTNCPQCVKPVKPEAAELRRAGITESITDAYAAGIGCAHCRGSGYRGRRAIAEILEMNDDMRDLIQTRAPIRTIKEAAQAAGIRTLREAALDMVKHGQTTIEEVRRVTLAS